MLFLLCELFILIFRKTFFVVKFSHYNIYFSLRIFILIREHHTLLHRFFLCAAFITILPTPFGDSFKERLMILPFIHKTRSAF